jgi:hypothetical protein
MIPTKTIWTCSKCGYAIIILNLGASDLAPCPGCGEAPLRPSSYIRLDDLKQELDKWLDGPAILKNIHGPSQEDTKGDGDGVQRHADVTPSVSTLKSVAVGNGSPSDLLDDTKTGESTEGEDKPKDGREESSESSKPVTPSVSTPGRSVEEAMRKLKERRARIGVISGPAGMKNHGKDFRKVTR